jgi:hypothetical protein
MMAKAEAGSPYVDSRDEALRALKVGAWRKAEKVFSKITVMSARER